MINVAVSISETAGTVWFDIFCGGKSIYCTKSKDSVPSLYRFVSAVQAAGITSEQAEILFKLAFRWELE